MKRVVILLATVLSALSLADRESCDVSGVAAHAQSLDTAARTFQSVVTSTPGYAQLANDAYQLSREAGTLSIGAHAGSLCHHLQHDYQYVAQAYQRLAAGEAQAQIAVPNGLVQQYWANVEAAHRNLYVALTQAPVIPPPPPALVTLNVDCGSSHYKYKQCPVAGRVVAGQLLQQLSHSGCQPGRSYGFLFNAVWVDRGCHGLFSVTVQP